MSSDGELAETSISFYCFIPDVICCGGIVGEFADLQSVTNPVKMWKISHLLKRNINSLMVTELIGDFTFS